MMQLNATYSIQNSMADLGESTIKAELKDKFLMMYNFMLDIDFVYVLGALCIQLGYDVTDLFVEPSWMLQINQDRPRNKIAASHGDFYRCVAKIILTNDLAVQKLLFALKVADNGAND